MKFIESIRLENGELCNLALHQHRLSLTQLAHYGASVHIDLERELSHRSLPAEGIFKIRVTYGRAIETIEIDPYTRRRPAAVFPLAAENLDYRFKYADRSALDALRLEAPPGTEPLIVQGGLVTDGLYANVCFWDGQTWLTPAEPLLAGVARAAALAQGQVVSAPVRSEDVRKGKYSKVKLINCMTLFEEAGEIWL